MKLFLASRSFSILVHRRMVVVPLCVFSFAYLALSAPPPSELVAEMEETRKQAISHAISRFLPENSPLAEQFLKFERTKRVPLEESIKNTPSWRHQKAREAELAKYDLNKDGEITLEERQEIWQQEARERAKKNTPSANIRREFGDAVFHEYDRDSDGTLDDTELADAERDWHLLLDRKRKENLAKYDKNKDGTIDEAEHEVYVKDKLEESKR